MEALKANATRAVKAVRVKNRAPAPIQITAEQLLLEARERAEAQQPPPPKQHLTDLEELKAHRLRVRKEFEERVRINRHSVCVWLRYAKWEEEQQEVERARSVYERTLEVDFKTPAIWIRYAEMEMRNKFVNRARNVWDRAVTLLPRVDSLWYKYTYMEEMVGNVAGARIVFERWMAWEPAPQAWLSFIKLEERTGALDRARALYERYVACHPNQAAYLRYAKWEDRHGQKALARRVFERAMEELRDDERDELVYLSFAKFEEKCNEYERAKVVYKYGLTKLPKAAAADLYREYVAFEKQHGDRQGVEDVILTKRRGAYEDAVRENPLNYDAWFDYTRLEEADGVPARIREVYERAIANVPPVAEKRFWRRYIYLWINYALYEELVAGDVARTRAVYTAALKVVPHTSFTFAKLWMLAAKFEIRQKDLAAARRILGTSLGLCPREKVMKGYIALELQMGAIDRCRKLYAKYLELWPFNVAGWVKFAELETSLSEVERARGIYELAVSQPNLDMPEVVWKAFIDFEIEHGEMENARTLYESLLGRTQHLKVWLSYAAFEASIVGDAVAARRLYDRAHAHFKSLGDEGREVRAEVLRTWHAFEQGIMEDLAASGGDTAQQAPHVAAVESKLPRRVTRRRPITLGSEVMEEYVDYVFPEDETKPAAMKLLEMAAKWKKAGGTVASILAGAGAASTAAGEASSAVGQRRPRPEQGEEGAAPRPAKVARLVAGADEGGDGDVSASLASSLLSRAVEAAEAGVELTVQSAFNEAADSDDEVHGREVERELEDQVRAAAAHGGGDSSGGGGGDGGGGGAPYVRDLFTEEDAGDAADRDP